MKGLLAAFCLFSGLSFATTTNVLFIGNSYTHMNNMPKIFEKIARSKGKDVYADSIAVSGSTLKAHAGRESTYKKLKTRKWDYVVIQGFSLELAQDPDTIRKNTIPYVQQILDSLFKTSPCANVYFYMTWGYRYGFPEEERFNTNEKMQARVKEGYLLLQQHFNYPIVPVGLSWAQIKQEYPSLNLYYVDDHHPNVTGSFVIASCFYTAFFKESSVGATAPKGVDSAWVRPLATLVSGFILSNYNTYHLNQVQHPAPEISPYLNFSIAETWTSVVISNKSKNCTTYSWDYGDGHKSNLATPKKHYYAKSGTYTVTLTATKDCHSYTLKKRITVSKEDKFATRAPKKKK